MYLNEAPHYNRLDVVECGYLKGDVKIMLLLCYKYAVCNWMSVLSICGLETNWNKVNACQSHTWRKLAQAEHQLTRGVYKPLLRHFVEFLQ